MGSKFCVVTGHGTCVSHRWSEEMKDSGPAGCWGELDDKLRHPAQRLVRGPPPRSPSPPGAEVGKAQLQMVSPEPFTYTPARAVT